MINIDNKSNRQDYLRLVKDYRPAIADFILRAQRRQVEPPDMNALLRMARQLADISDGHGYAHIGQAARRAEEALAAGSAYDQLIHAVTELHRYCHEALVFLPSIAVGAPSLPPANAHARSELPLLLAIDDDRSVRAVITTMFAPGAQVLLAQDGLEGWELLQQYAPALVLLDDTMPGMTGMRLLERMRQDARLKDITVVMLTSSDRPQDIARARSAGVYDYVLKPFAPDMLAQKIWPLLMGKA